MSANPNENTLEKRFIYKIKEIERLIEELRQNDLKFFIVPKLSSDPTNLVDGMMWYNTTSGTFKCRQNGVTKTFTTS